jgi:diketogulonate reductase-like aldo/keto reductase
MGGPLPIGLHACDGTTSRCATKKIAQSPAMLPFPGTLSLEHLKESLAALEIELSEAEFRALL